MRRVSPIVLVCLVLASPAAAQVEPDLTPLLAAAEDDCAAEQLGACRSRAELVLAHAPERSAVRVRARGLVAITEGTAGTLGPDEALEPLAVAAERAAAEHEREALASYAAALRLLAAEGSPLLARLREAEAAAAEPPGATLVPPGYGTAPTPTPTPTYESTYEPEDSPRGPEEPTEPLGYHRRDDGELVDFYIMSAAAGAGFTGYLFGVNGWATDLARGDEGRVYAVATVLGGGAFLLLPFGLDQIDHGMPAGAPAAIAMGLRFGLGIGGLSVGLANGDVRGDDVGHLMMGTTLAGGLLFGSIAYLTLPHPSQVQMIQNTGLWGGAVGGFLALAILPNVDRDGGQIGSGLGLLGLGGGLLTGSILSGLDLHLSSGRSWLGSLGMVSGAGAGMLVYLLIGGVTGEFDPTIAGVSGLIGSLGGLTTALILTEGHQGEVRFPDGVTVGASVAPLEGGGMATLSGTF